MKIFKNNKFSKDDRFAKSDVINAINSRFAYTKDLKLQENIDFDLDFLIETANVDYYQCINNDLICESVISVEVVNGELFITAMHETDYNELTLDTNEAAELLGCSKSNIYRLIKEGRLSLLNNAITLESIEHFKKTRKVGRPLGSFKNKS